MQVSLIRVVPPTHHPHHHRHYAGAGARGGAHHRVHHAPPHGQGGRVQHQDDCAQAQEGWEGELDALEREMPNVPG